MAHELMNDVQTWLPGATSNHALVLTGCRSLDEAAMRRVLVHWKRRSGTLSVVGRPEGVDVRFQPRWWGYVGGHVWSALNRWMLNQPFPNLHVTADPVLRFPLNRGTDLLGIPAPESLKTLVFDLPQLNEHDAVRFASMYITGAGLRCLRLVDHGNIPRVWNPQNLMPSPITDLDITVDRQRFAIGRDHRQHFVTAWDEVAFCSLAVGVVTQCISTLRSLFLEFIVPFEFLTEPLPDLVFSVVRHSHQAQQLTIRLVPYLNTRQRQSRDRVESTFREVLSKMLSDGPEGIFGSYRTGDTRAWKRVRLDLRMPSDIDAEIFLPGWRDYPAAPKTWFTDHTENREGIDYIEILFDKANRYLYDRQAGIDEVTFGMHGPGYRLSRESDRW